MAKNTYGKFYKESAFIISNSDIDVRQFHGVLPPESFTNPPLKLNVLRCDLDGGSVTPEGIGIEEFLHTYNYDNNNPDFNKNYIKALHGELEDWRMSAVYICKELLEIRFATSQANQKLGYGMVTGYGIGEVDLLFETNYDDGLPPFYHLINFVDHCENDESQIITITEMIGKRKLKKREMRADNFGYSITEGLYCLVTEY